MMHRLLRRVSLLWHSIRFRLGIILILFVFSLFYWMQTNTSNILSRVAVAQAQSSVHLTSVSLNLALTPFTTRDGLRGLEDYFQELLMHDGTGLLYLSLYDDQGRLLVTTRHDFSPNQIKSDDIEQQIKAGVVNASQPILIYDNKVGELRYGLSTVAFRDSARQIQLENLTVLLIAGVLFSGFLLLLSAQVNLRLHRLMRASRAVAKGQYQTRVEVDGGKDEISALAETFNLMSQAVADRMQALEMSKKEIHQLNAQLEDRVQKRTWELESALDSLQEAQESLIQSEKLASLGALVAGVAHELNTPIGNALTVVSTCQDKDREFAAVVAEGALKKSHLVQYLEDMQLAHDMTERNLRKAGELIQSFKQVAIDQTSYQRRRFNLKTLIQEVLLTIHPMFKQSKVDIEVQVAERVQLDSFPGPLGQILTNLVSNAHLHAFDKGQAGRLSISGVVEQDWLILTVADNGKGIQPEHLNKVFDPFFTTKLGQGGSGLGLHIVHNLVTGILGGQIRVYSGAQRGTQFVLHIPLVAPTLKGVHLE